VREDTEGQGRMVSLSIYPRLTISVFLSDTTKLLENKKYAFLNLFERKARRGAGSFELMEMFLKSLVIKRKVSLTRLVIIRTMLVIMVLI